MLENYRQLPNGVIQQITINKISYNYDYSNKYNNYGEKANYISYLRLGVLLGLLKETPKSLVDIGYGNGAFLKACQTLIPNLFGCDLSEYPVPDGCKKIEFNDISNVDVTCFFDSLEHFDDITVIKNLDTKYIFISVPWCHYISDEWFQNWYHRRENEHLYHFNEAALIKFFDECGYDCLYTGCFEDCIRINPAVKPYQNILSGLFVKKPKV